MTMTPSQIAAVYLAEGYTRWPTVNVPPPPVHTDPTPSATLRWHLDSRGSLMEVWRRSWGPLLADRRWSPSDLDKVTTKDREAESVSRVLAQAGHPALHHPGHVSQVYVSTTRPGVVKAWHAHTKQTDRFVVVRGAVLVGLCDLLAGDGSNRVQEVVLDSQRGPRVLTIPPGVAHGWMALDHQDGESWVLNLCSHEYNGEDEYRRGAQDGPASGIAYDWRRSRDG